MPPITGSRPRPIDSESPASRPRSIIRFLKYSVVTCHSCTWLKTTWLTTNRKPRMSAIAPAVS